jgi:L-ascorbate metabolism protein UlaG (beta-lactamase superfamily)
MPKYRFNNIDNVSTDKTLKQFRQWREERRRKIKDYSFSVPFHTADVEFLHSNREETTVTWIGHSTFLIQYLGLNIVTDPVWAERMALSRRLARPGIPIQDVPPLDVILLSHSHYDHLHINSLRKLYSAKTQLIVPSGLKSKMIRKGFHNCVELNWWEHITIGGVRISFVPAQHWTRRTLTDTNTSHWGGYVLESEKHLPGHGGIPQNDKNNGTEEHVTPTLYFVGDTGYFRGFKDIGERYDIDVTLMPIGAYEPEWFMTSQHVTPEEALQGFLDTGSELMVPMHYGTFKLADDTPKEALDRLEAERRRLGIAKERIRVLGHGEMLRIENRKVKEDSLT